ncbi:hypothetical protein [Deinococcus cavernae]|uniref:hypothetical protein n=1 Tax=Deinococcus cavernae TaxID=2320857 RepID=UPI001F4157A9|nr:hypothetical protein [Deinococcus cavernae]
MNAGGKIVFAWRSSSGPSRRTITTPTAPAGTSLPQLRNLLSQTRSGTVDLARQLHKSPPDDDFVVEHNGLGH